MNSGWIKLHRKLWDNPIVTKDAEHLAVWIYLLTHASHEKYRTLFGGKVVYLRPGQLITGRNKLADETGVDAHKCDRILNFFKSEQQINRIGKPYGSLISIVNWNKYQIEKTNNEQQMSNNRATSEQQVSTKQEDKEDKESSSSVKHTWLSDALTSKEWDRLTKAYQNVTALIDLVDNQTTEIKEIEKPYKYILGVANKLNWPRR